MPRFRVDLRSDTVSMPSEAMRAAMASAEVGDAWYGDDPTVNRLQDRAAELTGMEAALYVATGTMANQIGVRLHAGGQGHLVACETSAHVGTTEVMTSAVLAGIAYRTGHEHPHGYMTAALAERLLEPDDYFDVEVVDALAVENTVGSYGGTILPSEELRGVRAVTSRAGVPVHLDGARVWNAVAATGEEVTAWTGLVDTMMFCLSKGLGAPIGSVLCGPAELIREARRIWILYGGAWRQAGIMAAAGIVALETGRRSPRRGPRPRAAPRGGDRRPPAGQRRSRPGRNEHGVRRHRGRGAADRRRAGPARGRRRGSRPRPDGRPDGHPRRHR